MIERGRSRDGLPVGRQGLVHAARPAALASAQRTGALRAARGQSRSEAAGLSAQGAAAIPASHRRPLPHHRAGHLSRGQARDPRGPTMCWPVLAAAPRRAVPLCQREWHHQDCARAPPRRHCRDAVPEPVSWRPPEGDGSQAALAGRAAYRHSTAGLHSRARYRPLCRRMALSADSVHAVRLATQSAAPGHQGRCSTAWEREYPGRMQSIFSALRQVEPATLADTRLFDFAPLRSRAATAPATEPAIEPV